MRINATMSIREAMEHAAKGLLHHIDLPETMCSVEIEIPRPQTPPPSPENSHNIVQNHTALMANKINLIKFARSAQSAIVKANKALPEGTPPLECMGLKDARRFVEEFYGMAITPDS